MGEFWHGLLVVLGYGAYYLTMLAGVLAVPLGIPGEFIIVGATLVFILAAGSSVMSWWVFGILVGLGLLAEGLEAVAGYFGARRCRGSIWSAVGALGGGLLGAFLGMPFGLIVGSVLGALAGTFAGAFAVEYLVSRHRQNSANVATGALLGRLLGTAIKTGIALTMIVIVTVALIL